VDDVEGFAFNTTFKARRDSVAEASVRALPPRLLAGEADAVGKPGIDGDPASGWPRTL
jgi:hypothetical protein